MCCADTELWAHETGLLVAAPLKETVSKRERQRDPRRRKSGRGHRGAGGIAGFDAWPIAPAMDINVSGDAPSGGLTDQPWSSL
jgi:hypothetical protein